MAAPLYSDTCCFCVHCVSADTARLRTDKNGKPYIRCFACGATSFLPSGAALRGTIALGQDVVALARERGLGVDTETLDAMLVKAQEVLK